MLAKKSTKFNYLISSCCLLFLASFLPLSSCIDKPKPVTVIFMLDSSASSARYRKHAIATVKAMSKRLDTQLSDKVVIYKLGEEVYHLYSGEPKFKKLTEIMDAYAQSKPTEKGTAY